MKSSLPSVNLLRFERKDVGTQFLDWALTVGRLLVIVTEAVAFTMFIYRFTIDRQLVDLHDYIKQRQPYLAIEAPRELEFRDLQDRLAAIKQHENDSGRVKDIIQETVNDARGLVVFQDIKITDTLMKLDAKAPSVAAMKQFIDKLRASSSIKSLSIDKVQNDTTNATILFSLSILRKKL